MPVCTKVGKNYEKIIYIMTRKKKRKKIVVHRKVTKEISVHFCNKKGNRSRAISRYNNRSVVHHKY